MRERSCYFWRSVELRYYPNKTITMVLTSFDLHSTILTSMVRDSVCCCMLDSVKQSGRNQAVCA